MINKILRHIIHVIAFVCTVQYCIAQSSPVEKIFPKGNATYTNVPYANDTIQKHLLDIYFPPNARKNLPLVVWIHGGAWMLNDKYADMGYMKNTRSQV